MRKMHVALLAIYATGFASAARANTIVQSEIVPLGNDLNTQHYVAGRLYDPALGALTSVTFDYTGTLSPNVEGEILGGAVSQTVTITPSITNNFVQTDTLQVPHLLNQEAGTFSSTTGDFILTGDPEGFDLTGSLDPDGFYARSTAASLDVRNLFDAPRGSSAFQSQILAGIIDPQSTRISLDGDTAMGSGTFTLTYTYTPVPEPSSWATLATGALLLAGLTVRAKRAR